MNSAPNEWGVINEQIGHRSGIAYSDFDSEDPVRCYSAAKFGPCGHCLCPCFVVDIDRDMDLTANTSELNNIITETHIQDPNMRFDFCGQSPH